MSNTRGPATRSGAPRNLELRGSSFYVTGGTLPREAPSYIERRADLELYQGLCGGEICYVLTARQMGKSSLMVRTAARLREAGVSVAVLDLTAVGQNLDAEQWYDGLLALLGRTLNLEDELEEFWLANQRLGPLQRWMAAVREVVLAKVPGRVVLFLDEIDAVRSLPFSADELFAAIRECYNHRSEDPEYGRLAFCLLGVATPLDLIRDTRTTPFNIGRRIDLDDFTPAEAATLAVGLKVGELGAPSRSETEAGALLARVLHWTGGHPYLTQRVCQAIASGDSVRRAAGVDRLCTELFLSPSARERDDNLLFVRERLLRSEADRAALLDLYAQVRKGGRVPADETNPLVGVLRLVGIVRVAEPAHRLPLMAHRAPALAVRNRIYHQVFDRDWVTQHMPDAELRRQHAAYRRGLVRATTISAVIVGLVGALGWTAYRSAADTRRLADDRRHALIGAGDVLYASQMNLAHLAYKDGKIVRARRLLEQHLPRPGEPDRRDFVWRYLWRLCRSGDQYTFPTRGGEVNSVDYSPDGRVLATGAVDGAVELWDPDSKRRLITLPAHKGICRATFSPDGRLLATVGGEDGAIRLWDLQSRPPALRRQFRTLRRPHPRVLFTPDGETLIAASNDNGVRLWDIRSSRQAPTARPAGLPTQQADRSRTVPIQPGGPMALSTDGSTLAICAAGAEGGVVTLWDIRSGALKRLPVSLERLEGLVESVSFSPDGRMIATGARRLILWDARTGRVLRTLSGHEGMILTIAFSPRSELLASSGLDGTIRLWDPGTGQPLAVLPGHSSRVASLTFSPDGKGLASASGDGTVRLWDSNLQRIRAAELDRSGVEILAAGPDSVGAIAFSPDGKLLSEVRARTVMLWDVASRRKMGPPLWSEPGPERSHLRRSCGFSADSKLLATASRDGSVRLWDVRTRRVIKVLRGPPAVVTSLAFGAGGILVTANGGGSTGKAASRRFWEVSSGELLAKFPGDLRRPQGAVAVTPDGKTMAMVSPQHRVELWDVASQRPVAMLDGEVAVNSLAFSADGRFIAAGGIEGSISVWDRASRRRIQRLEAHVGPCLAVAFAPHGNTLASGGMDGMVRLWNPTVDQEEATLTGHRDWVWSLAFSPDGNLLASGGPDGTVRLWRASPFSKTDAPPLAFRPRSSSAPVQ